jgi:hypothetical protein
MSNKDTLVYKAYTMLRNDADAGNDYKKLNWASHVKTILTECGLLNVWNDQDLYVSCLSAIMERITDIAAQNWYGDVANSSKLSTYVLFKTVQCKEEYLGNINNTAFRTALTRFRVSTHDLPIERGRYTGVARENRLCRCCSMNVLENEYHFLLVCPAFSDIRNKYLSMYYCHWPSLQKFVYIMSSKSCLIQIRLSKFLYFAFRNYILPLTCL